jgi:hypothetical protein
MIQNILLSLLYSVPRKEKKNNILGGHSIDHSKQKKNVTYMYTCPILNGFHDTAISLYSSKTVDKKYCSCF